MNLIRVLVPRRPLFISIQSFKKREHTDRTPAKQVPTPRYQAIAGPVN